MKTLVCEMCGSTDLVKKDGMFVCQHCNTKYSVEEAKKMMIEGTVDVSGSKVKVDSTDKVKNLYVLARRAKSEDNAEQASLYYEQISMEEPNSWEAQFYKTLFACKQAKIAQIGSVAYKLGNCIPNVFNLIGKNEQNKTQAYRTVYNDSISFSILLSNNVLQNAQGYSDASYAMEFCKKHLDGIAFLNTKLGDNCKKVGMKNEALQAYKASCGYLSWLPAYQKTEIVEKIKELDPNYTYQEPSGGCYVATAVYGSYDCPEVWTLRRYRDYTLAETWYGRAFIRTYYAISPTLVKWFGHTEWFKKMWQGKLDRMVAKLQANGVKSTPYEDKNW